MFSEAKVTEIYCLADDFCKEFAKYISVATNKPIKKGRSPHHHVRHED